MYFRATQETQDLKPDELQARNQRYQDENQQIRLLGIEGVYFCKVRRQFVSRVFFNGREIILGESDCLVEAELTYLAAADDFWV